MGQWQEGSIGGVAGQTGSRDGGNYPFSLISRDGVLIPILPHSDKKPLLVTWLELTAHTDARKVAQPLLTLLLFRAHRR
jgi:hypothetical protein